MNETSGEKFAFQRRPGEPLWQFSQCVASELRTLAVDEESLGRAVREIWVEMASAEPDPKPSWLLPWEELDDFQKAVDAAIGVRLFIMGMRAAGRADV